MIKNIQNNLILFFWFVIFSSLFIPFANSFFVNVKKLTNSLYTNNNYKNMLTKVEQENKTLSKRVRYYDSPKGLKSLIKDKLNKVEEGESLIKFDDSNKKLN